MKVTKAAEIWINYHTTYSKKNTVRVYQTIITRLCREFGDIEVAQLAPEDVLNFLNLITGGNKPYTKRVRHTHLSSFFNFVCTNIDPSIENPCEYTHDQKALSGKNDF